MNENIITFLKKLGQDEEAQKKLSVCRDPEEAYDIAHGIQDGFTKEEFIEAMTSLNEQINQDLGAEDLASTAGGISDGVKDTIATVTVITTAGSVMVGLAAAI